MRRFRALDLVRLESSSFCDPKVWRRLAFHLVTRYRTSSHEKRRAEIDSYVAANPHGYFHFSKNGPIEKRMFAQDCDRSRMISRAAATEA